MSREIDLSKQTFTEDERRYLQARPWLLDDNLRERLENSEVEEATGYDAMTKKALRIELKKRDLDYSNAKKDELIARLQEADAKDDEGEEDEEPDEDEDKDEE